jgi:hypothetical protein
MEQRFIRVLPFYLQPICDEPELEVLLPVALWKSARNICEGGCSRCDDNGLYYSLAGDAVTWWCPRHWYENCFGPNAPYRLLDMNEEQFQKERADQKQRLLKSWQTVSEQLVSSASILSNVGLQEEAGKLWQAHGSIRSSIAGDY